MAKVVVDDITLEYEQAGNGEPVVFIHGALIADTFMPLLKEVELTKSYRLITYHRRGYAGSGHSSLSSISRQAADCSGLLRELEVDRAHVVGHSFGGAIALQLALDSPDLVHSLALLEPALAIGNSGQGYRDSLTRGSERFKHGNAEAIVEEFLEARRPGLRNTVDRVLPGAYEMAVADAGTAFERDTPEFLAWRFGDAQAREVKRPVLSVLGAESNAIWDRFGETHRWLLDQIPGAEEFILPRSAHFMQLENLSGLIDGLTGFWSRHRMA